MCCGEGGKKGRREARLEEKESESKAVWKGEDERMSEGEGRERRGGLCLRDGGRR